MTWEETIKYIRQNPEYKVLVEKAYLSSDLTQNVERFKHSDEFVQTSEIIKQYLPSGNKVLDIGSGNGISAVAFAIDGFEVTAIEPDGSDTVGAGAITLLKDQYKLQKLIVLQDYAENLYFENNYFDIVYFRQAMHHAYDLKRFLKEATRVLKPGGLLLSIRDHVVFDEEDKKLFLKNHPLQKFYGGENAFSPAEYKIAMLEAGLIIKKELKFFESSINFFPLEQQDIMNHYKRVLLGKFYFLRRIPYLTNGLVNLSMKIFHKSVWHKMERQTYGRMYSYICIKK